MILIPVPELRIGFVLIPTFIHHIVCKTEPIQANPALPVFRFDRKAGVVKRVALGFQLLDEGRPSGTGETYYYYKCSNAKRGKGCKKKAVRKDAIEYAVVKFTVDHALSEAGINRAADMMIAAQEKGNQLLPALRKRLEENKLASSNLLDAVQKGFYNETVKARMEELEAEKTELETQIIQEEMQMPNLTRDMILHWMERFKHGDIRSVKFQKQIIDYFVKAVYVYDDRIVLTYNFKDDSKTITLEEVNEIFHEELTGSSLTSCGEPSLLKSARNTGTFLVSVVTEFSDVTFPHYSQRYTRDSYGFKVLSEISV
ncbi:MAG: zinc ribbon domain-containing protein [Clostridia bacterium]|nr:zinc ribbon domain-containing protein [Clostridia bacterium]